MSNAHTQNADTRDENQDSEAEQRAPITGKVIEQKPQSDSRRGRKSAGAFRTISEVADALDVQQHVLRFWETKFSQIRPLKRGGGRRYYRPEDLELLQRIHHLLYTEGYTIKGVQKLLREKGRAGLIADASPNVAENNNERAVVEAQAAPKTMTVVSGMSTDQREAMMAMLRGLKDLRETLKAG